MKRRNFLALGSLAALPLRSKALEADLLAATKKLPVVDSHEHIIPESERLKQRVDFFTLAGHYAINDVISAGLPEEAQKLVRDQDAPMAKRWEAFAPYWEHARFTGYGQALRIAIRDVYGIHEISAARLPAINEAIAAWNKPGLYDAILRRKGNIQYAIVDDYWNPAPVKHETDLFVPARKFDQYIMPSGPKSLDRLEQLTGVTVSSLPALKRAMEKSFEQSLAIGMVTVKSTIAYARELGFAEVSDADAARDFERMAGGKVEMPEGFRSRRERPFRMLEDHMFHHLCRLAVEHRKPFQIHTGILAGNGAFIHNTRPVGLTNLFYLYPEVNFDLFHIAYPYTGELASMAKLFPNVHIDFTWAHIIAPTVSRRALHEFLDTVPVNKIFGYGGDYRYPELSYAHLVMARKNIARVLSERVEDGVHTEDEALQIGRLLLHDNAMRVFPRAS
jgi:predicted TIM-barrel fold metal-dependent hydrolase